MNIKKIVLVGLIVFLSLCVGPAFGVNDAEAITSVVSATPVPTLETAPSLITGSDVVICWKNGYAEMTIEGNPVRVPTSGFTYTSRVSNNVIMARENISVNVNSVTVTFVASGVADKLNLKVEYTSGGKTGSFNLGEADCLSLSSK